MEELPTQLHTASQPVNRPHLLPVHTHCTACHALRAMHCVPCTVLLPCRPMRQMVLVLQGPPCWRPVAFWF